MIGKREYFLGLLQITAGLVFIAAGIYRLNILFSGRSLIHFLSCNEERVIFIAIIFFGISMVIGAMATGFKNSLSYGITALFHLVVDLVLMIMCIMIIVRIFGHGSLDPILADEMKSIVTVLFSAAFGSLNYGWAEENYKNRKKAKFIEWEKSRLSPA